VTQPPKDDYSKLSDSVIESL